MIRYCRYQKVLIPYSLLHQIDILVGSVHVVVLACIALQAVFALQYLYALLRRANILTVLIALLLQFAQLMTASNLIDNTLVARKEKDKKEYNTR